MQNFAQRINDGLTQLHSTGAVDDIADVCTAYANAIRPRYASSVAKNA
jgi:hypothetical protein